MESLEKKVNSEDQVKNCEKAVFTLCNDLATLTNKMESIYKSLPSSMKGEKSLWRPVQKQLQLLNTRFEKTFFFEEKMKLIRKQVKQSLESQESQILSQNEGQKQPLKA